MAGLDNDSSELMSPANNVFSLEQLNKSNNFYNTNNNSTDDIVVKTPDLSCRRTTFSHWIYTPEAKKQESNHQSNTLTQMKRHRLNMSQNFYTTDTY
jgi:hypothetical protein